MIKARDLKRGDCFLAQVSREVVQVVPVASGERIKVVAAAINPHSGSLEYLDEGCVVALVCKPGRRFSISYRRRDDDDGDEDFTVDPPDPTQLVDA